MRWHRAPGRAQTLRPADFFRLSDPEQREPLGCASKPSINADVARYAISAREKWTIAGFSWSLDGTIHVILVERLAVTYRDLDAIALQEVASAGRNSRKYPYRQKDAKLAVTRSA
jgi:hypothetical protein